jgi:Ankyrin repeat
MIAMESIGLIYTQNLFRRAKRVLSSCGPKIGDRRASPLRPELIQAQYLPSQLEENTFYEMNAYADPAELPDGDPSSSCSSVQSPRPVGDFRAEHRVCIRLESIIEEGSESDNEEEQLQNGELVAEPDAGESQHPGHISHLASESEAQLASALKSFPTCPECLTLLTASSSCAPLIRKANIGMRDERGYTVLALAARHGQREIVLQLLHRGANPNSRSYQGTSLLAHARAHLARAPGRILVPHDECI